MPNKLPAVKLGSLFMSIHRRKRLAIKRPDADVRLRSSNGHKLAIVREVHTGYARQTLAFDTHERPLSILPAQCVVERKHAGTNTNTNAPGAAINFEPITVFA